MVFYGDRSDEAVRRRFEEKVDRSGECHRWTAAHHSEGYGVFNYKGEIKYAHVVALLLEGVDVPSGMMVDHVYERGCRHRDCVRVDHLDIVTPRENSIRGFSRGQVTYRTNVCHRGHDMSDAYEAKRANGRISRRCRQCALVLGRESYRRRQERAKGLLSSEPTVESPRPTVQG